MPKLKIPQDLELLREKVRSVLGHIREADESTKTRKDFLFTAQRTDAGRSLPPYYLVYFLLHDLLGFKDLGKFEKIAWSIPIDYKGKAFLIEHRKFGIGVFASNLEKDEPDAKEIVKRIQKAVKIATPYFEWLANEAVYNSKLNVKNKCIELLARYQYLADLYFKKSEQAKTRKNEVHKEEKKKSYVTETT